MEGVIEFASSNEEAGDLQFIFRLLLSVRLCDFTTISEDKQPQT